MSTVAENLLKILNTKSDIREALTDYFGSDPGNDITKWSQFIHENEYGFYEYLTNNLFAHLDTGCIPNDHYKIEIELTTNYTGSFYMFGTRTGEAGTMVLALTGSGSNGSVLCSVNGTTNTTKYTRTSTPTRYRVIMETNNGTMNWLIFNLTNNTSDSGSCSYGSIADNTLHTFLFSNGFNILASNTTKVYYAKIWDNGILLRYFIPALYRGFEAGMYDTVNDLFYTSLTTTRFSVGGEILNINDY